MTPSLPESPELLGLDPSRIRFALRAQQVLRAERDGNDDWRAYLLATFPRYFGIEFAPHHEEMWEWVWEVRRDHAPDPFVAIWARGGGKSTNAEAAVASTGLRGTRRYALYVRETQDMADKSVGNIGALLESQEVAKRYPIISRRAVGKYGQSRGWRRNRLTMANGFVVDALGLDTAVRGIKFEEQRPDFIVFDDVDGKHDTEAATAKKIDTITHSILPAGAKGNLAVLVAQNLIIPNGIVSRLADGRADFMVRRRVSGPHPAVRGLQTEQVADDELGALRHVIVAGEPTWAGQDLDVCQEEIELYGLPAFLQECQHLVGERPGALWTKEVLERFRLPKVPEESRMVKCAVAVDPSGGGDDIGIVAGFADQFGHVYVLRDVSQPGPRGPLNWGAKACQLYHELGAGKVVCESNYGGDLVVSNVKVAAKSELLDDEIRGRHVNVEKITASRGKQVRAEPVASLYEEGRVHHVGRFPELEGELTSWVPSDPDSPNRLDALVWLVTYLVLGYRPPSKAKPLHWSN